MAEEKKPMKVINATTKKRSVGAELGKYAMDEIIVPKSKEVMRDMFSGIVNMFADAARGSVDKFLYPDGNAPKKNQQSTYYTGHTNYTSYSKPIAVSDYRSTQQRGRDPIGSRSGCDVECVWVATEDDAKDICELLIENIENYGKAKVATLYEKIGKRTTEADFSYGWTNRDQVRYFYDTKSPDASKRWYIDLPKPVDIRNV